MSAIDHFRRFTGLSRTLPARLSDWFDQREAARMLAKLDDRALADIGLTRADVGSLAPVDWQEARSPQSCVGCQ